MNDTTAAFEPTDWAMTQEHFDSMVALASPNNEPVALRTEVTADDKFIIHINGPIVNQHSIETIVKGAVSSEDIIRAINKGQDHSEIIKRYDSGGGQISGGHKVVAAIKGSRVPISSHVDGYCASQAFLYASSVLDPSKPENKFIASNNSQIGSIGIEVRYKDDPSIKVIRSKNAKFKNSEESMQHSVDASEDNFLIQLAENFSRPKQEIIDNFGQGLVFTAAEALERKMIQGIAQSPAAPAAPTTTTGNQMTTESNTGAENTVTVEQADAIALAAVEAYKAEQRVIAEKAETARLKAEAEATARENKINKYASDNNRTQAAKLFLDPEQKAFFAMDADTAIASLSIAAEDVKAKPKAVDAMASTDPDIEFSGDEQEFSASGGDGGEVQFKYGSKWNDDTYAMLVGNGLKHEEADAKCKELMAQDNAYGVQFPAAMGV